MTSMKAADHLSRVDPVLKRVIGQTPLPIIASTQNVFHDLLSCVIEQQIHYRSTKRVFTRVLEAAELERVTPQNFSRLAERGLPTLKLSGQKVATLGRVVSFFERSTWDWQGMSDDVVRTALSEIKGIGPWTVEMILLYTLERPDVFPVDDYHLKQIMHALYDLEMPKPTKKQLRAIAEPWVPFRSTAVRYLLAWKELHLHNHQR